MRPENIEFLALLEASSWSQSEAARRLELNRATVSQYVHDTISPSAQVLALFKLILANEQPGALSASLKTNEEGGLSGWERRAIEDLRWLHKEDRDRVLNAMKALVAGLPRRAPVNYKINSETDAAGTRLLKKGVAAVVDPKSKPRRSRGAGAPSARTSAPDPVADKD